MESDDAQKKTKQFLVRVEDDVHVHFSAKAKARRVSVAVVLRELMYEKMQADKREEELTKQAPKGKTNGTL